LLSAEKVVDQLRRRYGVSNLKEFEEKISAGEIFPQFAGDFSVEDNWLLWSEIEYKERRRNSAR